MPEADRLLKISQLQNMADLRHILMQADYFVNDPPYTETGGPFSGGHLWWTSGVTPIKLE